MRGMHSISGWAAVALIALAPACSRALPFLPQKPMPSGTFQMKFTRWVAGPMELNIDGVRIPVIQKAKKPTYLTITGLSVGKHRYFMSSPQDAFGPDLGEFEMTADKGIYQVHFVQKMNAVLMGKIEAAPAAEGLPGVKAILD